jgi:hypothetical protein
VRAAQVFLGDNIQSVRLNPLSAVDRQAIARETGLFVLKREALHFADNGAIQERHTYSLTKWSLM